MNFKVRSIDVAIILGITQAVILMEMAFFFGAIEMWNMMGQIFAPSYWLFHLNFSDSLYVGSFFNLLLLVAVLYYQIHKDEDQRDPEEE